MVIFFGFIAIWLAIAGLIKFCEWLATPKQEDVLPRRRRKVTMWSQK